MICAKHPKYKGKLKPRASCINCWVSYLGNRPQQEMVSAHQLSEVLEALLTEVRANLNNLRQDIQSAAPDVVKEHMGW